MVGEQVNEIGNSVRKYGREEELVREGERDCGQSTEGEPRLKRL